MTLHSIALVVKDVRDNRGNRRGNASIEYFVIGATVALAVLAFYGQGQFQGASQHIDRAFHSLVDQMMAP